MEIREILNNAEVQDRLIKELKRINKRDNRIVLGGQSYAK